MHSAQVHKWTHREGELFFDRSFFLARTLPHFVNDFFFKRDKRKFNETKGLKHYVVFQNYFINILSILKLTVI